MPFRLIVSALLAWLTFSLMGQSGNGKNKTEATPNKNQSEQGWKEKPPSYRFEHYDHPTEAEHRTAEQFAWRAAKHLGAWAAIAASIAAFFAYWTWLETKRGADIAQDNLFVSDRPWIGIEKVSVDDLQIVYQPMIDPTGFVMGSASVFVRNLGHSPAINLFISADVRPMSDYKSSPSSLEATTDICKSARDRRVAPTLQVVFPDQSNLREADSVPVRLDISSDKIIQAGRDREKFNDEMFAKDKIALGESEASKFRQEHLSIPLTTSFALVGCVTYFSYRGLIGQTGFAANIYQREQVFGPNMAFDRAGFDMTQDKRFTPKDLNVVEAGLGGIYVR